MLSAIKLNYQVTFLAAEVGNGIAYWELPAESESIQPPRTQMKPQGKFGVRLLPPKSACAGEFQRDRVRIGQASDLSLTLPLDKGREQN
jgi:hypothetical protein